VARAAVAAAFSLTVATGCSASGGATGNVPPLRTGTTAVAVGSPSGGIPETPSPAASTSGVIPALTPTPGSSATASSPVSIGVPPPTAVVPGTPAPGDYSDAAVVAAAKAYVRAFSASAHEGNPQPFLAITRVQCGCRNRFLPALKQQRQQKYVSTIELEPLSPQIDKRVAYSADVHLDVRNKPYRVVYPDGHVDTASAHSSVLRLRLSVLDRRWLVEAIL